VFKGNPNNISIDLSPFIQIENGLYHFGKDLVNWFVAYENCRKLGSDLVTFETDEEFDAVTAHLKDFHTKHWTSGNDLGKTGNHNWFSNGKRMNTNRWAPNQPDNSGGKEHCIHMGYMYKGATEIELNDYPCGGVFWYVCEIARPETISIVVWK
ncbi:hypothetical protein KR018_000392, partial [Drosophila ironensis]